MGKYLSRRNAWLAVIIFSAIFWSAIISAIIFIT